MFNETSKPPTAITPVPSFLNRRYSHCRTAGMLASASFPTGNSHFGWVMVTKSRSPGWSLSSRWPSVIIWYRWRRLANQQPSRHGRGGAEIRFALLPIRVVLQLAGALEPADHLLLSFAALLRRLEIGETQLGHDLALPTISTTKTAGTSA